MDIPEAIKRQLDALPTGPGVYLMRDRADALVYIGKAVNLRSRVRSYFRADGGHSPRTRNLVSHVGRIETIMTDTEVEALVLENLLIKQHRPRFNVLLKDDKTYPFLKLTLDEAFPRLVVTRRRLSDGARYFGPYPDVGAMRATLKVIQQVFPLRQKETPPFKHRPCLNHSIGRCLAPCQGLVTEAEYRKLVDGVVLFLEGRHADLHRRLTEQMTEAASRHEFERAAKLRDRRAAVERIMEQQKVVGSGEDDQDVLGAASDGRMGALQLFQVRRGKLVGRLDFQLAIKGADLAEALCAFLPQYYAETDQLPKELVLPFPLPDAEVIGRWLSDRRGSKVTLTVPKLGGKLALLEMAQHNAQQALGRAHVEAVSASREAPEVGLLTLAEALGMADLPHRIECFDISHIQGSDTVASMVVFEDGLPLKSAYRRFKIRNVQGVDDFAAMNEVVGRRYGRLVKEGERAPDLVIIDGGKGQLSSAMRVFEELGLQDLTVFGLAKREEEVFLPGRSEPVILPEGAALHLIQRIRDEAHRFAVTFHRERRSKRMLRSALDDVPGIGEKRKRMLLARFGSVDAMRELTLAEWKERSGLPTDVAETLHRKLQEGPC